MLSKTKMPTVITEATTKTPDEPFPYFNESVQMVEYIQ